MRLTKFILVLLIAICIVAFAFPASPVSMQPLSPSGQRQQNNKLFAPMTFSYHATDPYFRTGRFYILAEGVITPETPAQFLTFFKSLDRGMPTIYFNSPGGDLKAGLRLGRIIRELGLDTFVGGPYRSCFELNQKGRETSLAALDKEGAKATDLFAEEETCQHCTYSCDSPMLLAKEGICFSACAYAFLGGVGREVGANGIYGVHQFRSRDGMFRESDTQIAMTILATYLDEMGTNRKLLDLASVTPSGDIEPITLDIARKLNIDNYNPPIGEWEIEVSRSGQLFAYVTQRLPGRDAQISFFLSRKGNQFHGTIHYSIHQGFRTADEIADAFSTNNPPQISGERYTARLKVTEWWKPQRDGSYMISFLLDLNTLRKMSQERSFTFDSQFPNVYRDLLPFVEISTSRLQQVITALQRQR
jgi:hypothetical protein